MNDAQYDFLEFFAGGGMARLGLGKGWRCRFANDLDSKKAAAYQSNFSPASELAVKDIRYLTLRDLPPGRAALAWASFPCQDLSLAGDRKGLAGERSSTFWPFWSLMEGLARARRPVPIVVLENVVGAVTSNDSRDLAAILEALASGGYHAGPLVIDSIHFVPQSRPRLFIVAVKGKPPARLQAPGPIPYWHPDTIVKAHRKMPARLHDQWTWWRLPSPPVRKKSLPDLIEDEPSGVEWHPPDQTRKLLDMMSEANRRKVAQARAMGRPVVGTIYKRTRRDEFGEKVQRAEVRFDQVSGCLRTPAGGSSRQIIMVVNGKSVRSRLISPREIARLMGVPESYRLPERYNEAYHLMGDGLVVPVISFLERHLLRPLAQEIHAKKRSQDEEAADHPLLIAAGN